MAWTAPATTTVSQVVTSAFWNQQVRDNFLALNSSYGTSLPASPGDGYHAILVDSTTLGNYQWRFRYNLNSLSAYGWEFVGGSSLPVTATTAVPGTSVWTATASFTVPRSGVYMVTVGWEGISQTGGASTQEVGIMLGGVHQAQLGAFSTPASSYGFSMVGIPWALTCTAGQVLATDCWANAAPSSPNQSIMVIPLKVS